MCTSPALSSHFERHLTLLFVSNQVPASSRIPGVKYYLGTLWTLGRWDNNSTKLYSMQQPPVSPPCLPAAADLRVMLSLLLLTHTTTYLHIKYICHARARGARTYTYDLYILYSMLDFFTWHHQDFLVLAAAGNDGEEPSVNASFPIGYMSVISLGSSKNGVTVGATENDYKNSAKGDTNRERLAYFSSR